jgi:hypothetical protein
VTTPCSLSCITTTRNLPLFCQIQNIESNLLDLYRCNNPCTATFLIALNNTSQLFIFCVLKKRRKRCLPGTLE